MTEQSGISRFDGIWQTTYLYEGPAEILAMIGEPMGGCYLVVRNGVIAGSARGGNVAHGRAALSSAGELTFTTIWDGRYSEPDVWLADPVRGRSKGLVTYQGTLGVQEAGGRMLATGRIQVGPCTIVVTMRKVMDLQN